MLYGANMYFHGVEIRSWCWEEAASFIPVFATIAIEIVFNTTLDSNYTEYSRTMSANADTPNSSYIALTPLRWTLFSVEQTISEFSIVHRDFRQFLNYNNTLAKS